MPHCSCDLILMSCGCPISEKFSIIANTCVKAFISYTHLRTYAYIVGYGPKKGINVGHLRIRMVLQSIGQDRSWTGDYAAILRTPRDSRMFPTCSRVMTGVSRAN